MQKHTYLNRNFFDTQRKKYRAVEEIAIEKQAVCLKTEDNKLLKIFHSLDDAKSAMDRLEWLKELGTKDDSLSDAIAMPSAILTGLKRDEVGYVCEPMNPAPPVIKTFIAVPPRCYSNLFHYNTESLK